MISINWFMWDFLQEFVVIRLHVSLNQWDILHEISCWIYITSLHFSQKRFLQSICKTFLAPHTLINYLCELVWWDHDISWHVTKSHHINHFAAARRKYLTWWHLVTFYDIWWYSVTFDDIRCFLATKPCRLSYVMTYHELSRYLTNQFREADFTTLTAEPSSSRLHDVSHGFLCNQIVMTFLFIGMCNEWYNYSVTFCYPPSYRQEISTDVMVVWKNRRPLVIPLQLIRWGITVCIFKPEWRGS